MEADGENRPADPIAADPAADAAPDIGRSELKSVLCFAGLLAAVAAAGLLLIYAM